MSRVWRVQPAAFVDHITADGQELTKLPYPYYVHEDGSIARQDFWQGRPARAVGFMRDLAVQTIDLWWTDAVQDPQRAVGMYLVLEHTDRSWYSTDTAVDTVTEMSTEDAAEGGEKERGA